jgi:thioredoxin-related protein
MPKSEDNRKLFLLLSTILLLFDIVLLYRIINLGNKLKSIEEYMQPPKSLDLGVVAPNFSTKDNQGNLIELKNYKDERLLLVFSSPSCVACQVFWPELKGFSDRYPETNIVMISNGTIEEVQIMQDEQNFSFPIIISEVLFDNYKIPGTPYLYLISSKSEVEFTGFSNSLEKIQRLLGY